METSTAREQAAEAFLQEAVYRSRAAQSAAHVVRTAPDTATAGLGNCGLGRSAEADLDLSPRGAELYGLLWPAEPQPSVRLRLRELLLAWIREQDMLDRRRNHFLRDFRTHNGFDRNQYSDEQRRALARGLEQINSEESRQRGAAARTLLGLA